MNKITMAVLFLLGHSGILYGQGGVLSNIQTEYSAKSKDFAFWGDAELSFTSPWVSAVLDDISFIGDEKNGYSFEFPNLEQPFSETIMPLFVWTYLWVDDKNNIHKEPIYKALEYDYKSSKDKYTLSIKTKSPEGNKLFTVDHKEILVSNIYDGALILYNRETKKIKPLGQRSTLFHSCTMVGDTKMLQSDSEHNEDTWKCSATFACYRASENIVVDAVKESLATEDKLIFEGSCLVSNMKLSIRGLGSGGFHSSGPLNTPDGIRPYDRCTDVSLDRCASNAVIISTKKTPYYFENKDQKEKFSANRFLYYDSNPEYIQWDEDK
ncbi:MAG: hypothetical protein KDD52_03285 [Bdellovibrionales bacterium]|nr:hypothetical protein [Bdellovibrionales bacterium]